MVSGNANTFRNNSLGLPKLPLEQRNPGFTLSGPVIIPKLFGLPGYRGSKRTFFFTAYEYDTVLDTSLVDTLVPVERSSLFPLPAPTTLNGRRLEDASAPSLAAEIAPYISTISTPSRNHRLTVRLDHKFSDTHHGSFLYQLGRLTNLRQFGGGNRLAEALLGRTRHTDALAYSDHHVFSPKSVNQMRIQFSLLTPAIEARGGASPVVLISINDLLIAGDPFRRTGTLVAGTSTTES